MIGNPTSHQLTFSESHGNLVVNYRTEAGRLIPMQDGKDVAGWRWQRK